MNKQACQLNPVKVFSKLVSTFSAKTIHIDFWIMVDFAWKIGHSNSAIYIAHSMYNM